MGKTGQSLQFVCRSCRQSISRPSSQLRTFSSSASRAKTIPSFRPTSSPELDALFLDWRQRVFTPAALNTTHQALVYKKSRQAIIENDPGVTVTMSDGEEVKLQPMNRFDQPNKLDSLQKIANILSNTTDTEAWSQLPVFLRGMALAKATVPVWWLEKITRKANEQGQAHVIKQCAALVKETGLSLSTKPVTRELFLGCHLRLVEARSAGEKIVEEQTFAKSLALMLEKPEHCGNVLEESSNTSDMRRNLTILGVLLELAALKATHVHQKRDVEGEVGNLCQKLIAMTRFNFLQNDGKRDSGRAIEDWLPIANGIKLALQINGLAVGTAGKAEAELKASLKDRLNLLDKAIGKERSKLKTEAQGQSRRALAMLEKLRPS